MSVIPDTSMWSMLLRRGVPPESEPLRMLEDAIDRDGDVFLLGIVKQELLSGIRHGAQFRRVARAISNFPEILASSEDHATAAKFYNRCRSQGVQGSPVDFLICAQAYRIEVPILTDDRDFLGYAAHLPIDLH